MTNSRRIYIYIYTYKKVIRHGTPGRCEISKYFVTPNILAVNRKDGKYQINGKQ